jgi:predicted enzyme related to lactoylglutathione lyase
MTEPAVRGSFVWHDLMTGDIPGAVAYYGKVAGWKTQAFDANYLMWAAKTGPIGGVGALPADQAPHWLSYVATDDIEATLKLTQKLGGKVIKPVTDISNGGKYAVLSDPQGAVFGVHWSAESTAATTPPSMPPLGTFSWLELATSDYQAAFAFYQALFGWEKVAAHDIGEMGIYFIYGMHGRPFGGMFTIPPGMPMPAAWCGYVQVADARKTAKIITKAGGKIINGPMEVPGGSWIVQAIDPQGAVHAVVSSLPMTAAAPAAEPASVKAKAKVVKKKAAKKKATVKPKSVAKPAAKKKAAKKKSAKKKAAKKAVSKAVKKVMKKVAKKKVSKAAAKKKSTKKKLVMKKSTKKTKASKKKVAKRKK